MDNSGDNPLDSYPDINCRGRDDRHLRSTLVGSEDTPPQRGTV